jgi:hypothetical protein
MYAFDVLERYWWFFLPLLILLPFAVEYARDGNDWRKNASEILTTMVAVFVAVLFAIVQTKHAREAERFDDALSIIEGGEKEASIVLNRLFSLLKPDIYVYSLESNDQDELVRSDIDDSLMRLLLMKSGDEIIYFLTSAIETPNKIVTDPVVLSNLSEVITNAMLLSRSNIELEQKKLMSTSDRHHDSIAITPEEIDRNQIFRVIRAIDHLRMISCVAKQCLGADIGKGMRRICDQLEREVVDFYDMIEFAEERFGCKRRLHWDDSLHIQ